jgi:hypothetical protein
MKVKGVKHYASKVCHYEGGGLVHAPGSYDPNKKDAREEEGSGVARVGHQLDNDFANEHVEWLRRQRKPKA